MFTRKFRNGGNNWPRVMTCPPLDPAATVEWVVDPAFENAWHDHAQGYEWHMRMFEKRPPTVAAVIALGGTESYPALAQLRWLYTCGRYIKIDGEFYQGA